MELRLEGDDGTKPPPYMTEPEGPKYTGEVNVFGTRVPVEVVVERGAGWMRRRINGHWSLWQRMTDG
jgi:hypothetical protein